MDFHKLIQEAPGAAAAMMAGLTPMQRASLIYRDDIHSLLAYRGDPDVVERFARMLHQDCLQNIEARCEQIGFACMSVLRSARMLRSDLTVSSVAFTLLVQEGGWRLFGSDILSEIECMVTMIQPPVGDVQLGLVAIADVVVQQLERASAWTPQERKLHAGTFASDFRLAIRIMEAGHLQLSTSTIGDARGLAARNFNREPLCVRLANAFDLVPSELVAAMLKELDREMSKGWFGSGLIEFVCRSERAREHAEQRLFGQSQKSERSKLRSILTGIAIGLGFDEEEPEKHISGIAGLVSCLQEKAVERVCDQGWGGLTFDYVQHLSGKSGGWQLSETRKQLVLLNDAHSRSSLPAVHDSDTFEMLYCHGPQQSAKEWFAGLAKPYFRNQMRRSASGMAF